MIAVYIIVGLIIFILLLGLVVSRDMSYEKSISINAPVKKVWGNINSLAALDKWSPWNEKDPNMEKTFTGTDGTVGARQCWKSKEKGVGEGCQSITKIEEPTLMETQIEFIKPFKSFADGYIKLEEDGSNTTASWGFKSTMPYPMNLMKLFMNFEKSMDKDFGHGLSKLKGICEK